MLSEKFMDALRNAREHGQAYHQIAWAAGITPAMLYKLSSGIDHPRRGDKRIKKLSAYLGFNEEEAFVDDSDGGRQ